MKTIVVIAAGILLALVLTLYYWKGVTSKKVNSPGVASVGLVTPKSAAPVRAVPPDVVQRIREAEKAREELLQTHSRPVIVKFYGRVVDENGAPVADARIIISPVQPGAPAPNTTDSDGRFLVDAVGPASSVFVAKKGYRTAIAANGQFAYEPGAKNPDYSQPQTPALFTLHRL